ncbi:MAG TPA: hypothetical protein VGY55_15830 [Pirellulales bacterium]|jgi:hypothetical protein|nr:hypothetical protein [Pirellulales bacterium]
MTRWDFGCRCAPAGAVKVVALSAMAVGSMALCFVSAGKVHAQAGAAPLKADAVQMGPYLEMALDPPTLRGWGKALGRDSLAATVKPMVRGDVPADYDQIDTFYKKQMFPQFTLFTEPGANVVVLDSKDAEFFQNTRLVKMREIFFSQFLNPAIDQLVFEHVEDLAIASMSEIAKNNYHPLARYHAVLLLAGLHQFKQSDKPYAKTWPVFVDCLDSIDPVKIAGMNAILHYVKAGIPGIQQAQIITKLEKLLADKTVAKGETPEGHDWVRCKAMDVILAIGEPAVSANVVADLVAILNDPQSSVELSRAAAKTLGSLPPAALAQLDLSTLAASIGRVAVSAARAELARAEALAFQAPLPVISNAANGNGGNANFNPRYRGAVPAPDVAAADAAPAPPVQQYVSLPLLRSQLKALEASLIGPAPATGAKGPTGGLALAANGTPHAQNVARVQEGLTALIAACDDKVTDYDTLKLQIAKGADALNAKLGNAAAAPAAEKAAGGDVFGQPDKSAPVKAATVK